MLSLVDFDFEVLTAGVKVKGRIFSFCFLMAKTGSYKSVQGAKKKVVINFRRVMETCKVLIENSAEFFPP